MPKSRKVGAHCPTNKERWSSPSTFRVRDIRIDPSAAQRKRSEGSFAVCSSSARATGPSECCSASLMVDGIRTKSKGRLPPCSLFIDYLRRGWRLGCASPREPSKLEARTRILSNRGPWIFWRAYASSACGVPQPPGRRQTGTRALPRISAAPAVRSGHLRLLLHLKFIDLDDLEFANSSSPISAGVVTSIAVRSAS